MEPGKPTEHTEVLLTMRGKVKKIAIIAYVTVISLIIAYVTIIGLIIANVPK